MRYIVYTVAVRFSHLMDKPFFSFIHTFSLLLIFSVNKSLRISCVGTLDKHGALSPPFLELSVIICDLGIVSVTQTHTILATLLINQSGEEYVGAQHKGYSLHKKK